MTLTESWHSLRRRASTANFGTRRASIFQSNPTTTSSSLKNMGVTSLTEAYFVFGLGLLLSLNSGYINGLCLSGLLTEDGSDKQGVSAFTGTYTKSGLALAGGDAKLFGFEFTLILAFIAGAIVAGMMNPKAIPHKLVPSYGPTFLMGALCMIAASIAAVLNPDHRTLYYFAAAANGIQNGMTSTYSANLIRTTHLTGTSTDIGLIIGQMIRGNMKNLWKFKVLVGLATSFWFGGLLSFYSATAFLSNSLWFSAALYLLIGLTHITFVVLTQKVGFFQACFGTYKWQGVLENMAASMTENGDKSIALKAMTHSQIDHVFDEIDDDGSGTIDANELMQALNKMGMKLTRKNVEAMMRVVDDNGDGVIDREEFFTLVKMSTLRAEHKREKRERRKESVVKIKQSFIAGASTLSSKPPTMADLSMRSGKSSEDSVPDTKHSALPRTYAEALPKEGTCDGRAIIVTETERPFRIVGVNKAWEDLCGYKEKEALQKSMSDLIQGDDTNRDGLKDAMNKLVHDGATSVEVDTVNYRKDKSMFKNHLVMGPLYNESEDDYGIDVENGSRKAAYYVGILTNIGELTQCLTMDKGEDGDYEEKMDDSFVENQA